MKTFLQELRVRNALLYYFGWLNFIGALICIVMIMVSDTQVLGIIVYFAIASAMFIMALKGIPLFKY